MKNYTTTEVAKMLDVSDATLRYWERKGLIKPIKTLGGHRRYTEEMVEELKRKMRGE